MHDHQSSSLEERVDSLSREMEEQRRMLSLHKRIVIYRGVVAIVMVLLYFLFPEAFVEYTLRFSHMLIDFFR